MWLPGWPCDKRNENQAVNELLSQVAAIDFLPARYREQSAKRRTYLWRSTVLAAFVMILGSSGFAQYRMYQSALHDLSAVEPAHAAAQLATRELSELQSRLVQAEQRAELLTYLRHPWSRSQVLSAVAKPLPATLTLSTLTLCYERDQQMLRQTSPVSESQAVADTSPATVRDLKRLRGELDSAQLVVVLTGQAAETAALHQYLAALAADPLFAEVELRSIEASTGGAAGNSQFAARIVVRPGYGQSRGPQAAGTIATASPDAARLGVDR